MSIPECDFALLGLDGEDIYLAGPFESALACVRLLARDFAAAHGGGSTGVIQLDTSTQRVVIMMALELEDGSFHTAVHLMIPVPRVEERHDIYAITDLGLWENELLE